MDNNQFCKFLFGKNCEDRPSKTWICKETKEAAIEHLEDGFCLAVSCPTHKSNWCCVLKKE